jgi:hypothetical protein
MEITLLANALYTRYQQHKVKKAKKVATYETKAIITDSSTTRKKPFEDIELTKVIVMDTSKNVICTAEDGLLTIINSIPFAFSIPKQKKIEKGLIQDNSYFVCMSNSQQQIDDTEFTFCGELDGGFFENGALYFRATKKQ